VIICKMKRYIAVAVVILLVGLAGQELLSRIEMQQYYVYLQSVIAIEIAIYALVLILPSLSLSVKQDIPALLHIRRYSKISFYILTAVLLADVLGATATSHYVFFAQIFFILLVFSATCIIPVITLYIPSTRTDEANMISREVLRQKYTIFLRKKNNYVRDAILNFPYIFVAITASAKDNDYISIRSILEIATNMLRVILRINNLSSNEAIRLMEAFNIEVVKLFSMGDKNVCEELKNEADVLIKTLFNDMLEAYVEKCPNKEKWFEPIRITLSIIEYIHQYDNNANLYNRSAVSDSKLSAIYNDPCFSNNIMPAELKAMIGKTRIRLMQ
jgi:hypothetical protein